MLMALMEQVFCVFTGHFDVGVVPVHRDAIAIVATATYISGGTCLSAFLHVRR